MKKKKSTEKEGKSEVLERLARIVLKEFLQSTTKVNAIKRNFVLMVPVQSENGKKVFFFRKPETSSIMS